MKHARTGLTAAVAATALAVTLVPGASTSAQAAATLPSADCARAYDGRADNFASLVDQPVTGLTVIRGTTPQTFHGTVVGVLDGGIDLATPLIMVRLGARGITDGAQPTAADQEIAADGVWEGMSGSPVYSSRGDLIGAVSTGLAVGNTDLVGLTPASAMTPLLPRTGASAGRPAASAGRTQLAQGFRPLVVLSERGLSAAALRTMRTPRVSGVHAGLRANRFAAGAAGNGASGATSMVAGGNVADLVVWGDFAEGAVGTVTSVCGGGLVAFGHPLLGAGPANDVLSSASAVAIQPDPLNVSFKIANLGTPVGTVSRDVSTAIAGTFGATPRGAATFTHTASYNGSTAHTAISHTARRDYWADATYFAALANDFTVLHAWRRGSALVRFQIKGTSAGGSHFTVTHTNRYASSSIADDSLTDVGLVVDALAGMPGVSISSVTTSSKLDDHGAVRLTGVQQRRAGAWRTVDGTRPAIATAGKILRLRAVTVTPQGVRTYLPIKVSVPRKVAGGHGRIHLSGANGTDISLLGAVSVADIKDALAETGRNDQVLAVATFTAKATRLVRVTRTPASASTRVINGSRTIAVRVR